MFGPLEGRALLDIGCGSGMLCAALARRGARMTGLDPAPDAIASAQRQHLGLRFVLGSADALPFPAGHADGAVFLNALHHVARMDAALAEAARVVVPGRPILVVEPLACGSFFDALVPIENESDVRHAAQKAVAGVVASGLLECVREVEYERADAFADSDAFLARVVAADARRVPQIEAHRAVIETVFGRHATRDDRGRFLLVQPLRAHVLRRPEP